MKKETELFLLLLGDRLLIGTGVGQLLVYDTKEPLGNSSVAR
jgi:hypothetical protein